MSSYKKKDGWIHEINISSSASSGKQSEQVRHMVLKNYLENVQLSEQKCPFLPNQKLPILLLVWKRLRKQCDMARLKYTGITQTHGLLYVQYKYPASY